MGTVITFSAPGLTPVVITGDRPEEGFTYDELTDWYGVSNVDTGFQKKPNAPGAFAPGKTSPGELVISVEGQRFGVNRAAGLQDREDLAAIYNDGEPITMTVADDLRTTSREVYVKAVIFPWTIHPNFHYTIDVEAADPRRYGTATRVSSTLAVAGSGLKLPEQVSPNIGLKFPINFGSTPNDGRVNVANIGNASTVSRYTLSGGEILEGFALVNVDTGERLTYLGPLASGTTVELDSLTETAFINGSAPAGRYLASPEWWAIPPRGSVTLQFIALGATTGTPRLDVDTAPAFY
jgi:hypothetical protein